MSSPVGSPLLDVFSVPVPAGRNDSPLDDRHVLDVHLGKPVQVACRMDGRERRGLQTHGMFCILPAGERGIWMMERPAHALILRLTASHFQDAADAMGLAASQAELRPVIHARDPQIERIAWMMQAEQEESYPGGRLFADSLASALAARLVATQSPRRAPPTRASALPARQLRHVLDYIEEHLDEDLTLVDLAAVADFSVSHFKTLFKQAVGLPVHRYVLERRVDRARLLLLDGRASRAQIALEAGFSHQSHMARSMRRVLGVTPSQIAHSLRRD